MQENTFEFGNGFLSEFSRSHTAHRARSRWRNRQVEDQLERSILYISVRLLTVTLALLVLQGACAHETLKIVYDA
jgi:hypothetical protein